MSDDGMAKDIFDHFKNLGSALDDSQTAMDKLRSLLDPSIGVSQLKLEKMQSDMVNDRIEALTALLQKKGVFTEEEFKEAYERAQEARQLLQTKLMESLLSGMKESDAASALKKVLEELA